MTVSGVRLQFSDVECFRENIEAEDADVVLTVVTDDLFGKSVYVDVMVRFFACSLPSGGEISDPFATHVQ